MRGEKQGADHGEIWLIGFPKGVKADNANAAQQEGDENIKRDSDEFVFADIHFIHVLIVLYLIGFCIVQKDNVRLYYFSHEKDDVDLHENGYTEGEI